MHCSNVIMLTEFNSVTYITRCFGHRMLIEMLQGDCSRGVHSATRLRCARL
jgi:hypothetical protein